MDIQLLEQQFHEKETSPSESLNPMLTTYLSVAALAGVAALIFSNAPFRRKPAYRYFWLAAVFTFLRHQCIVWSMQANARHFAHLSGPDGGFAIMGFVGATLLSLPFTAIGFTICWLWPKDRRLFSLSSVCFTIAFFTLWASGSWCWHEFVGPNMSFGHSLRAVDQLGNPVKGARIELRCIQKRERWLEVNELCREIGYPVYLPATNMLLTTDEEGWFDSHHLRASDVWFVSADAPGYIYDNGHPPEYVHPHQIFRFWKKGSPERVMQWHQAVTISLNMPEQSLSIWPTLDPTDNFTDLLIKTPLANPEVREGDRAYDRWIIIEATPNTELMETLDEYPYHAPDRIHGHEFHFLYRLGTRESEGWTKGPAENNF